MKSKMVKIHLISATDNSGSQLSSEKLKSRKEGGTNLENSLRDQTNDEGQSNKNNLDINNQEIRVNAKVFETVSEIASGYDDDKKSEKSDVMSLSALHGIIISVAVFVIMIADGYIFFSPVQRSAI